MEEYLPPIWVGGGRKHGVTNENHPVHTYRTGYDFPNRPLVAVFVPSAASGIGSDSAPINS